MQVTYRLGTILSSAFTNGNILLDIFCLCYASISLDASDYGCQLMKKLDMKLKVREPLDSCQEVFDTLNHIETLGHRSLTELASLHGLCFCSNPDQNNAQDIIANHPLSGDCVKTNGVFCDSVSSVSMSRSKKCVLPDDLPVLIVRATLPPSMLFADRALLRRGYSISEPNALVETISKYKGLH